MYAFFFINLPAWNIAQGAKGGCDGSIILNSEENARAENKGLQSISAYILSLSTQYSVSVADLIAVSDAGAIMPPKSTWFEPKLRDGLLIHVI